MYLCNEFRVNIKDLLKDVDQIAFVEQQCNITIKIKEEIKSYFREDSNPSCKFLINSDGDLVFLDQSRKIAYNYISFIMEFYKITYSEFCEKVINKKTIIPERTIPLSIPKKKDFNLLIKKRPIKQHDLDFWSISDLKITKKTLEYYKIAPLEYYSIYDYLSTADKNTYIFEHAFQQIYQPLKEKKDRYRAKTSHGLYGWNYLKDENSVIITKSFVDWFLLHFLGFNVLHVISEVNRFTAQDIERLKRFKKVFILFDNDKAGIEAAESLKVHGYIPIYYPNVNNIKDTKDCLKCYKSAYVKKIVNQLMCENSC